VVPDVEDELEVVHSAIVEPTRLINDVETSSWELRLIEGLKGPGV
jgi:hypothetical protein